MFRQLIMTGALLFSAFFFTNTIYAQDYILEDNVPILVRNSFYDNYSGAYDIDKDVRWLNEYRDSYTAEYSKDGMVYRITYDENGSIARTESQIEASTLPYLVRDNFLSAYPNVKIYYSGIIDDSKNGTLYRLGYLEADASPGTPSSYIYYKGDGTIYIWK